MPVNVVAKKSVSKRPSKRQLILEAALELYAESGFRGASLKAIGAKAGVTHAAVLYHFKSAVGILRAVIEDRDKRFNERYSKVFHRGPTEALANLPEVARFNVENADLARLHVVLAAESIDPASPVHDWFRQRARYVYNNLRRLLEAGIKAGEFRSDINIKQQANLIIAFMEGAQMQYFLDPQRIDLVSLYQDYSQGLMRDLVIRHKVS